MRAAMIVFAVALVIAGLASYFFYPVYPSPVPLCDLYVDPKASHVGAVVVVSGRIYGNGSGGGYLMASSCAGGVMYLGIDVPTLAAVPPISRLALNELTMGKRVRATVVGRVQSQGWGCFGPGTVLTAFAVNTSGPVEPFSAGSAALP